MKMIIKIGFEEVLKNEFSFHFHHRYLKCLCISEKSFQGNNCKLMLYSGYKTINCLIIVIKNAFNAWMKSLFIYFSVKTI